MLAFPNAKINLGLNITEKRADGYHNLETIFYPIHLKDALEIIPIQTKEQKEPELHLSGNTIEGNLSDNLVVKAYNLLRQEYDLPMIDIYLYKKIPSGAGLGGGSSDAAFMLKILNKEFKLNLSEEKLIQYATKLGADCSFFIKNKPVFASGIGNIFDSIDLDLSSFHILLLKPSIFVSTKEAFSNIVPQTPRLSLKEIIKKPLEMWKDFMYNDFEKTVFSYHPELQSIKEKLYNKGAIYASMSGSGSALYGLFKEKPLVEQKDFSECYSWSGKMNLFANE